MATYEQLLPIVTEVFARHVEAGIAIVPDARIVADLALDSLAVMEVVADLEDRFELSVPGDMLAGLQTVADVVRSLVQLLAAPQPS